VTECDNTADFRIKISPNCIRRPNYRWLANVNIRCLCADERTWGFEAEYIIQMCYVHYWYQIIVNDFVVFFVLFMLGLCVQKCNVVIIVQ
jgi:hypothetical protein